ncbi:deleted in malignant brain tumors 1 protein isoform X2 [Anguilla anguilla]|uniref:deleted in malignant brain tumors 1 protein isoform X2 n=1 Tax=Anguilla anguilla TaxID=7936 RepID=UPI0015AC6CE4|nr:deleted in malignant brain tumors 1 protein isoform X2 [Anguilla anguilla]
MEIRTITFLLFSLLSIRRGQGWYTTIEYDSVSSPALQCGGNLTDLKGEFTSPNYPGNYPNYAFCQWLIVSNGSNSVYLDFTYLRLENSGSCSYDSVSVYDGPSTSYRLLAKMCGQQTRSFSSTGPSLTVVFRSDGSVNDRGFHARYEGGVPPTSYGSCRYNCGYQVGSCSCSSSCRYYGNCCHDYNMYCGTTTNSPVTPTGYGTCRYNCGYHAGSCSCSSSCRYYGNCCHDYNMYCGTTTNSPVTPTGYGTCRYNCGYHAGSCSCSSSCRYYGNCCHDYNTYCGTTTESPHDSTAIHPQCGGNLNGSGSFSSPNYPSYYHDNAYCVWRISALSGQRVVLAITDVQLENCCSCDYIEVYDGSSLSSRPLGKVCLNSTTEDFHSSSRYLTVLFRSDSSVVSRGFRAHYTSSLPDSAGRVDCSSDNMTIVIQTSYLNSVGYSGYDLYLNDQYCRPSVSSYQVVFSFAPNTCGTRREFNNGRIVYTNGVRAYKSRSGEITRQSQFKLQVLCRMEQDATAQIMYVARERVEGNITGSGRFNVTMAFYTSGSFNYPVYDSPYVVSPGQYLYVQVRPRRTDSSLVLFLDTCVASPSPHDFHTRTYDLVRNGCKRDSSYYEYSSGSREVAQFRFQAFAFLRSHAEVYLQCKVAICRANDYSSRCSQGCRTRKARSLRSAANDEAATILLGPIQLRDPKKPEEGFPEESVVQMEV